MNADSGNHGTTNGVAGTIEDTVISEANALIREGRNLAARLYDDTLYCGYISRPPIDMPDNRGLIIFYDKSQTTAYNAAVDFEGKLSTLRGRLSNYDEKRVVKLNIHTSSHNAKDGGFLVTMNHTDYRLLSFTKGFIQGYISMIIRDKNTA